MSIYVTILVMLSMTFLIWRKTNQKKKKFFNDKRTVCFPYIRNCIWNCYMVHTYLITWWVFGCDLSKRILCSMLLYNMYVRTLDPSHFVSFCVSTPQINIFPGSLSHSNEIFISFFPLFSHIYSNRRIFKHTFKLTI